MWSRLKSQSFFFAGVCIPSRNGCLRILLLYGRQWQELQQQYHINYNTTIWRKKKKSYSHVPFLQLAIEQSPTRTLLTKEMDGGKGRKAILYNLMTSFLAACAHPRTQEKRFSTVAGTKEKKKPRRRKTERTTERKKGRKTRRKQNKGGGGEERKKSGKAERKRQRKRYK